MILECGLLLGLKRHEMRILTSARGETFLLRRQLLQCVLIALLT